MTPDEFLEIMDSDFSYTYIRGAVFLGLQIIRKYMPLADAEAAEHDIIYSVDYEEIATLITKEDALALRKLSWHVQDGQLARFV